MPICAVHFAIVHLQYLGSIALVVASYLCGSVPYGVLIARTKGVDIQRFRSGNIGATNVARACGLRFGLLVFGLDFLKGFGPTLAAKLLGSTFGSDPFMQFDLPVLCALAAVLGHVFSCWLGFRGGKAGATGLGVGTVICWQATLAAGLLWLLTVLITRYVSLGTILGSIAYVAAYFAKVVMLDHASPTDREYITATVFCIAVASIVIVKHKDNIRRLLAGTENKVGTKEGLSTNEKA